ncbi:hypothetical protein ONE63_009500 [Megalurothrips usitatus]|uniref:Reverse transcriptase domain-containing protein n=1 Tax=Megalurothrips usitatus TaxID=439358 RepID=A0AAV7XNE4_9NEOP|nr:hypothetical protein ONE63_009500 [Megalurothrips usitatus]
MLHTTSNSRNNTTTADYASSLKKNLNPSSNQTRIIHPNSKEPSLQSQGRPEANITSNFSTGTSTMTVDYRPSRKNAIVLENTQKINQDICLRAVADKIGGRNIHYVNRLSGGRLCLYLTNITLVDKMCEEGGIVIGSEFIPTRRYVSEAKKIVISNCPPELSDDQVKQLLEPYGRVVSNPTRLRVSTTHEDLKHIKTWRRTVYMMLPENDQTPLLPSRMTVTIDDVRSTIYIERDEVLCNFCLVPGHSEERCKKKQHQEENYHTLHPPLSHRLFVHSNQNKDQSRSPRNMVLNQPDMMPVFSAQPSTQQQLDSLERPDEEETASSIKQTTMKITEKLLQLSTSEEQRNEKENEPCNTSNISQDSIEEEIISSDWHNFGSANSSINDGSRTSTSQKRVHSPDKPTPREKVPKPSNEQENRELSEAESDDSLVFQNSSQSKTESKKKEIEAICKQITFDPEKVTKLQFKYFLNECKGKQNSKAVALKYSINVPELLEKLTEAIFKTNNFNFQRRLQLMLSLASLNTKGLVSHHKQLCLHEFLKINKISIIFLQETNLKSDDVMAYPHPLHYYINPPTQQQSGVAIAIESKLHDEVTVLSHLTQIPGYLQSLHIKIQSQEYHLVNVYIPHQNQLANQLINEIDLYLTQISEDSQIILGGDWNVTLSQSDRRNCIELRTDLANSLQLLIRKHSFTDAWRQLNPDKMQFTFKALHQNHPMARLDRIYIKKRNMNSIIDSKIIPSFSDHSGLTITLTSSEEEKHIPPYWKFDVKLLKSKDYSNIIINIISHFEEKSQNANHNIINIWDSMKEEIKFASQRFTKKLHEEERENLSSLLAQLSYINSKQQMSRKEEEILMSTEKEISDLYRQNANMKKTIIETDLHSEANMQSKFFLNLARQAKKSAAISNLQINGVVTNDKNQIFTYIQQHYKKSFSQENLEPINPDSPIYQDLPSLSHQDRDHCDTPLTEEEILESIKKAQLNRAPGLDGIPIEFYKFFWDQIKIIFLKVVQNFHQTGELPASMKKIVISPIPKKGDRLQIKNWRQIALINTDYKVISRAYSKKISSVISTLLSSDQSYCVPGRTISDNIHLIRNIIRHSNQTNSALAIYSLDQSEAFNRVSHQYIFHLLQVNGFGPQICQAISSLLKNTKAFIKIGSSLLPPFVIQKGFRQGDPIAGLLYIISIEPFLRRSMQIKGYEISKTNIVVKSTAFADDITFFISKEEDYVKIKEEFDIYSNESGGQLNYQKSSILYCGEWKTRNTCPIETQLKTEGDKFLGVYLGNTQEWEDQNWQILAQKITATLNKWSQFVKLTSFRGRKIICNQLAGSVLIHILNVLNPPDTFIKDVEKSMVNFVWQGKHWLHPNLLFKPPEKGGQGLMNVQAKINTLRLSLIYKIQEKSNNPSISLMLHQYNLSLCRNLPPSLFFCQEKEDHHFLNLETFYLSLAKAWHNLDTSPIYSKIPIQILKYLPLQGSKIIKEEKLRIIPDWKNAGFNNLSDLMDNNCNWKILNLQHLPITQRRRLSYNYIQIKNYINNIKTEDPEEPSFQEIRFQFETTQHPKIFPTSKKQLYISSLEAITPTNIRIAVKSAFTTKKINWSSFYSPPTAKKDSDIPWRLLHNILVTPRKLKNWNIIASSKCPWCNKEGDALHMFFLCNTNYDIWKYVAQKINMINESTSKLSLDEALVGFPPTTDQARLANFLLSLAKSTIYKTYMNFIKEDQPNKPNYLLIFKNRLNYRLALEKRKASITKTEENFNKIFSISNALSV